MNLKVALELAEQLLDKHGLRDWQAKYQRKVNEFGRCNYRVRTIFLSSTMVSVNEEPAVFDTILHEIAHALVGSGHGHDQVWKAKAIEIGCNGKAQYSCKDDGVVAYRPWKLVCPACSKSWPRVKRVLSVFYNCPKPCGHRLVWEPTEQLNTSPRPRFGVTLRVWEIADELMAYLNRVPTKVLVIYECRQRLINPGTAAVQYGKWLSALDPARRQTVDNKEVIRPEK